MKVIKLSILLVAMAMGLFSCQKGNTTNPTNPVKDTSYLLKTQVYYTYDAAGNKSTDSTTYTWTYDAQRRPILAVNIFDNDHQVDSSITFYNGNEIVADQAVYNNGKLISGSHYDDIYFYNTKGFLDSVVSTSTSISTNGPSLDTSHGKSVTVYYNDAAGHDTTAILYNLSGGGRVMGNTIFHIYVNNNLSRVMTYTSDGFKPSSSLWVDGNLMEDTVWNPIDGSLLITHSFTYTNVLSGGYYGYAGNKDLLLQGIQGNSSFADNNFTYTNTYTFDDLNRVSTEKQVYSNQTGYSLAVGTYY